MNTEKAINFYVDQLKRLPQDDVIKINNYTEADSKCGKFYYPYNELTMQMITKWDGLLINAFENFNALYQKDLGYGFPVTGFNPNAVVAVYKTNGKVEGFYFCPEGVDQDETDVYDNISINLTGYDQEKLTALNDDLETHIELYKEEN